MAKCIDHTLLDPQGRVSRNKRVLCSASKEQRKAADSRSIVATTRLRAKLDKVKVVLDDSSGAWCHVVNGAVVASFLDVGAAVAALGA